MARSGYSISIAGTAIVGDHVNECPVIDHATLKQFSGIRGDLGDDTFSKFIQDERLLAAGISGGGVEMLWDQREEVLLVETRYSCERALDPALVLELVDYTRIQWSDGIGESDDIISGVPKTAAPDRPMTLGV